MQLLMHPEDAEALVLERSGRLTRRELARAELPRDVLEPGPRPRVLASGPPFDGQFVTGEESSSLEVRAWETLAVTQRIRLEESCEWWSLLATSPDGRWVAAIDTGRAFHVFHVPSGQRARQRLGAERVTALAFSPTSQWLAALMTSPQGGRVRVWRLADGRPRVHIEALDRRALTTPTASLRDVVGALAFSADGAQLALYESSARGQDYHVDGWRGCVSAYDVLDGRLVWSADVDAALTGDLSTLDPLDYPDGVRTQLLYARGGNALVFGTTAGGLVTLDSRDGALLEVHALGTSQSILGLGHDRDGVLWVLTEHGHLIRVP
ncbi:MAG: hypothetical protein AAGI01_00225 [Myxococcota bacterium]